MSKTRTTRNKNWRHWAGCGLLILVLTWPALAEQSVVRDGRGWMQEKSGVLADAKTVNVTRFVGAVRVEATARTGSGSYILRVHSLEPDEKDARKHFANFRVDVTRKGRAATIKTVGPIDLGVRAELLVQLPAGADAVHVDTLAGKITVAGKVNRLELQTHGGDIELDEAELLHAVTMGGSVTVNHSLGDSFIRTGGGDIRVDASLGELEISSLGGNIWLKAIARGRIQSAGGNIEVVRCIGPLLVRTAGGNINLGEMGGEVTAESGGGSIRVGVAHRMVVASTALGNIELWKLSQGAEAHTGMGYITAEFTGERSAMQDSELVTSVGDIVVYFGPTAGGIIHAVTGVSPTRRMLSEFPDIKIVSGLPEFGPRSVVAEGPIHDGGPSIQIRTTVGQIELRKTR